MIAIPESKGTPEAQELAVCLPGADSAAHMQAASRRRFFGLIDRRLRWSFSWKGWAVTGGILVCLLLLVVSNVHPFLAVTDRTNADVLVVEGWLPNYALEECISEFNARHYRLVFTVGGEILSGTNIDPGDNLASYAAARFKYLGLKSQFVQAVPSGASYRDRTFASALALRQWAQNHQQRIDGFNLVTLGPHARRSRLLFEKAFGDKARVGIISVEDRGYDPARWWCYSEGVKEVVSESAAYLYARLFFWPDTRN